MVNVIIGVVAVLHSTALVWFFFAPRRAAQSVEDHGVQTAHITVKGGYEPAVVQVPAGSPILLDFDRQEIGECSSHVVFPEPRRAVGGGPRRADRAHHSEGRL